jgi:hypothetical protein
MTQLFIDPSVLVYVDAMKAQAAIAEHYTDYTYAFEPFAQLDVDMDVVRVLVEDVPFAEQRIVEGLTVFTRIGAKSSYEQPIGFALKSLLTRESRDIVDALVEKLDALAKTEKHELVRRWIQDLIPMTQSVKRAPRLSDGALSAAC